LDIGAVFETYRKNFKKPHKTPLVVAKEPSLAEQVVALLDI